MNFHGVWPLAFSTYRIELSMLPIGGGESLRGPAAKVLDIIDRSDLPYQLTAMGTAAKR